MHLTSRPQLRQLQLSASPQRAIAAKHQTRPEFNSVCMQLLLSWKCIYRIGRNASEEAIDEQSCLQRNRLNLCHIRFFEQNHRRTALLRELPVTSRYIELNSRASASDAVTAIGVDPETSTRKSDQICSRSAAVHHTLGLRYKDFVAVLHCPFKMDTHYCESPA